MFFTESGKSFYWHLFHILLQDLWLEVRILMIWFIAFSLINSIIVRWTLPILASVSFLSIIQRNELDNLACSFSGRTFLFFWIFKFSSFHSRKLHVHYLCQIFFLALRTEKHYSNVDRVVGWESHDLGLSSNFTEQRMCRLENCISKSAM